MGHVRMGGLPRSGLWRNVRDLLASQPEDVPTLVGTVLAASEEALDRAARDSALAYPFFVLVTLATAADNGTFDTTVRDLGIRIDEGQPFLAFLAELGDHLRTTTSGSKSGHLQDIAAMAMRQAMIANLPQQGSLLGSTTDALREGFRQQSGADQFGRLTRQFFGDFTARVLRAALDRDLSRHVGAHGPLTDISEARNFQATVERYASASSALVERFASDWYAKHRWHSARPISRADASKFVAHALRKLRTDLEAVRRQT